MIPTLVTETMIHKFIDPQYQCYEWNEISLLFLNHLVVVLTLLLFLCFTSIAFSVRIEMLRNIIFYCFNCISSIHIEELYLTRYTLHSSTRYCKLQKINNLISGKSKCFDSNGGLSLKFFGPKRRKTYMAFIPYRILYAKEKNEELKVKTSNLI